MLVRVDEIGDCRAAPAVSRTRFEAEFSASHILGSDRPSVNIVWTNCADWFILADLTALTGRATRPAPSAQLAYCGEFST